jgi:hypothetical protein
MSDASSIRRTSAVLAPTSGNANPKPGTLPGVLTPGSQQNNPGGTGFAGAQATAAGFFAGGIRFCLNPSGYYFTYTDTSGISRLRETGQAYINTGTQWTPVGNNPLDINVPLAANAIDQYVYVADRPYNVLSGSFVYTTPGGASCALQLGVCPFSQGVLAGAGTITTTNSSATVNGVSTTFTSALIGSAIFSPSGTYIGTVSAVGSTTSLTLAVAASNAWGGGTQVLTGSAWNYGPYLTGTGNLTASTATSAVTVTAAGFASSVTVGSNLYDQYGRTLGVIASVNSTTSLTLTANAAFNAAATTWSYSTLFIGVPAYGTNVFTATIPLTASPGIVQIGTLNATIANTQITTGQALALRFTGTVTGLAGLTGTVILQPQ